MTMQQPNYQLIAYELNVQDYLNTAQIYAAILALKQQFLAVKKAADDLALQLTSSRNDAEYAQSDLEIQRYIIEKFEYQAYLADRKILEQEYQLHYSQPVQDVQKELLQLRLQNDDLKEQLTRLYRYIRVAEQPGSVAVSPSRGSPTATSDSINYKITIKQQCKQIQELEKFKQRLLQKLEFDVDEDDEVVFKHVDQLKTKSGGDVERIVGKAEKLVDENEALKRENAQLRADNRSLKDLVNKGLEQIGEGRDAELERYLLEKQREIVQLHAQLQQAKLDAQTAVPQRSGSVALQLKIFRDRVIDLIDDMRIDKKTDLNMLKAQIDEIVI